VTVDVSDTTCVTRRSRIALTVGAVLVAVGALMAFLPGGSGQTGRVIPVAKRRPSIPIVGTGVRGEKIDIARLRGAPVVLNFWASWCGPCVAEQPDLERAAASTRTSGVHFVGVTLRDDNQAQARAFLDRFAVSYPSVVDESFRHSIAYGVAAPPATFVLDAAGRVAARLLGPIPSDEELVDIIDQVAREPA